MLKWLLRLTVGRDSIRLMGQNSCILMNSVTTALCRKDLLSGAGFSTYITKRSMWISGPQRTVLIGLSIRLFELCVGWREHETWGDGLAGCSATQEGPVINHCWQRRHILPETAAVHSTVYVVIGCPDAKWKTAKMVSQSCYSSLIRPL